MIDWVHNSDGGVHPIHQFTKLGTLPLERNRGFPSPYDRELLRVPGPFRDRISKADPDSLLHAGGRLTRGARVSPDFSHVSGVTGVTEILTCCFH